jgi:hypothetical protein
MSFAAMAVIALPFSTPVISSAADPSVEVPTSPNSASAKSNDTVTLAGETQSEKTVQPTQEVTSTWSVTAEAGYWSTYIFRGTNLTPNSDGLEYNQVYLSVEGFTLGIWVGAQLGRAEVANSTALGESGSGTSPFGAFGTGEDFAIQKRFHEIDLFTSYTHTFFGFLDLTMGNIGFFIFRGEYDDFRLTNPAPGQNPDLLFSVPENERFDRLYWSVSTHKLHVGAIQIVPTATYYQTVFNDSDPAHRPRFKGGLPLPEDVWTLRELGFIRNDNDGGYFEGKIQTTTPIIRDRLLLETTSLISYSAGDRSEAVTVPPLLAGKKSSSVPLYGFNHYQSGVDLVLRINRFLSVTGSGNYAYHIADPTAGTEREEWWGGGKVTVSFP